MEMSVTAALLNIKRRTYFDCQTTCFVQVARGKAVKKGAAQFSLQAIFSRFLLIAPREQTHVLSPTAHLTQKGGQQEKGKG